MIEEMKISPVSKTAKIQEELPPGAQEWIKLKKKIKKEIPPVKGETGAGTFTLSEEALEKIEKDKKK